MRRFVRWQWGSGGGGLLALGAMDIQDQAHGIVDEQGGAQPGGRGILREKSGKVKHVGGCGHQAVISAPNLCEPGIHGKVCVLKYLGR